MTEFTQISSITTDNRQRKIFDELAIYELAEGIKAHELLHAPVLLGQSSTLLAGHRRLLAMEMLHRKGEAFYYLGEQVPKGMAPVVRASDRDLLSLKEAELAENLLRRDLSWQERAAAEHELHSLRKATNPKQTLTETAREVKGSEPTQVDVAQVRENLLLSKHLDDPEIMKTKDRKAAIRKVQAKEQKAKREKVAEALKIQAIDSSPHTLIHGDMKASLLQYQGDLFDLVLTDPPYGVDASGFHDQFTIGHSYNDSAEEWPDLMKSLASLTFALTLEEAHAFVFCDIRKWPELQGFFKEAGWEVWPRPLIWDKGSLGALPKPKHGPRLCYEAILFATKGNKEILQVGRDVLQFPTPPKEFHAAQKPTDLYVQLIERTASAGSNILDPFAGSGTIFPAATRTGCIATGIEIEEEYYHVCLERINE